jgi:hypothetical protein
MKNTLTRICTILSLILFSLPILAAPHAAATIQFNNDADTKWIPFLSYQALFESLHALSNAEPFVIKTMSENLDQTAVKKLDQTFQLTKNQIEAFRTPIPLFKTFSGLEIQITQDKQRYRFVLPNKSTLTDLNLKSLTIDTIENRQAALKQLQTAKEHLDGLLPKNLSETILANFIDRDHQTESFDSEFTIASAAEAKSILTELNQQHHLLSQQLNALLKLASTSAKNANALTENHQFVSKLAQFDRTLNEATISVSLFTGNSVRLTQENDSKTYQLYPLSLGKFKLDQDDLLTREHAKLTYQHAEDMFRWVNHWILTGGDSIQSSKQQTPDIAGQYHSKEYVAFNQTKTNKKIYASNN